MFESYEKNLKKLRTDYTDNKQEILKTKARNTTINHLNSKIGTLYNTFELNKVELHKDLLISISYLLDEEHYFEEEGVIGGV